MSSVRKEHTIKNNMPSNFVRSSMQILEIKRSVDALLKRVAKLESKIVVSKLPKISVPELRPASEVKNTESPKIEIVEKFKEIDKGEIIAEVLEQLKGKIGKTIIRKNVSAAPIIARPRANFVVETPTGTIDGVNDLFYLTRAPRRDQMFLIRNSTVRSRPTDYSITGNQINYVVAPEVGDNHFVIILEA